MEGQTIPLFEVLGEFKDKKTPCFINGMPSESADFGGKIIDVKQSYVVFEVSNKTSKKEDMTIETIYIPLEKIDTISTIKKPNTLTA